MRVDHIAYLYKFHVKLFLQFTLFRLYEAIA